MLGVLAPEQVTFVDYRSYADAPLDRALFDVPAGFAEDRAAFQHLADY